METPEERRERGPQAKFWHWETVTLMKHTLSFQRLIPFLSAAAELCAFPAELVTCRSASSVKGLHSLSLVLPWPQGWSGAQSTAWSRPLPPAPWGGEAPEGTEHFHCPVPHKATPHATQGPPWQPTHLWTSRIFSPSRRRPGAWTGSWGEEGRPVWEAAVVSGRPASLPAAHPPRWASGAPCCSPYWGQHSVLADKEEEEKLPARTASPLWEAPLGSLCHLTEPALISAEPQKQVLLAQNEMEPGVTIGGGTQEKKSQNYR